MNLPLTLLLAYDVFPVILQNLRLSGVLFSKETVCEKFQIAREKVVVTVTTLIKVVVTCHRHIQSCALW